LFIATKGTMKRNSKKNNPTLSPPVYNIHARGLHGYLATTNTITTSNTTNNTPPSTMTVKPPASVSEQKISIIASAAMRDDS